MKLLYFLAGEMQPGFTVEALIYLIIAVCFIIAAVLIKE